jgi:ribosomal protein S18 acetylase RimI-like enzyme
MDLDPAFHGFGYAKYLYQVFCSEILLRYEVSNLRLRVLKSNSRAHSLYVSMGFAISEETQVDYEMRISLEKLISNLSTQLD